MRSATIIALFWATLMMGTAIAEAQDSGMPTVEERSYGDWHYSHSADRFSDDELWIAATPALSAGDTYALSFICYSNGERRVALRLGFLGLASDEQTKNLDWVVDEREPRTRHFMVVSSGIGGTLLVASSDVLAHAVRDGGTLYVRAEKYNGAREAYSFSLNGVSAALDAMPCAFDG